MSDESRREHLRRARRELSPSSADRHRLKAAVLATVTASAATGAASASAGGAVVGGTGVAKIGWLVAAVLVVGGAVVLAPSAWRSETSTEDPPTTVVPTPSVVSAPTEVSPEAAAPIAAPIEVAPAAPTPATALPSAPTRATSPSRGSRTVALAPEPPATVAPEPAVEAAPPAAPPLDVAGETRLLSRARAAIERGDGAAALAALDEHAARYPNGLLVEERLAERVGALCAAGRSEDADREAEAFLAAHAGSVHAPTVRRGCAAR